MKPHVLTLIVLSGAVACGASIPPPNDAYGAAEADVGRAQAAGASNNPDARLHLQLAQEDLQNAKQLMGENNRRATSLTELARAEAQLAISLARDSQAQDSAHKAVTNLQKSDSK
jgi:hypothetical protein